MDVLLCWSKERSRMMASALHDWLPKVIPALKPWMSDRDIDKGKDWFNELRMFLSEAKAVLVSVTPENVRSPWIYYECGQVEAHSNANLICPFLLEDQSIILSSGPLGRMQHTKFEKEDCFRLLKSLNKQLGDRALSDSELSINFEKHWDELAGSLKRIQQMEREDVSSEANISTDADDLAGVNLSAEERMMVLEMGQDKHGMLLTVANRGGRCFQTNGKNLNSENGARSTARWKQALKNLVRIGAVGLVGAKGSNFELTDKGFTLYDILVQETSSGVD